MIIKQILEEEKLLDSRPLMLMSLKEQPHKAILSGQKAYEFRTRFAKEETLAFIYVSGTAKEIQSLTYFGVPVRGKAEELSLLDYKDSDKSLAGLDRYFHHAEGCAIPVKAIWRLQPLKLAELKSQFENFVVPQSYYWLSQKPELLKKLLEMNVN